MGAIAWLVRVLRTRVWLAPLVVMLALGLHYITQPQVWRDELASWTAASRSFPDLWHLLSHIDLANGAYYVVLHPVIAVFGDGALAMRAPSVLAMCVATVCVSLIGQRLFSRRAGLAAGMVFALLPSVSRFAQEARAYAFVVMFVALATLFLLWALDRPSWWRWLLYALSLSAAGIFHLVALTCVAGHIAVIFLHRGRDDEERRPLREYWWFPAAVLVALLPVIPLALGSLPQTSAQIGWPKPDLHNPLGSATTMWLMLFCSGIGAGAVVVFAGLAWNNEKRSAAIGTALALLPTAAVVVASELGTSYYVARYLMFTVPAWAVLAGAGVATVSRLRGVAVALLALALLMWPDQQAIRAPQSHDWWNYPAPNNFPSFDYLGASKIIAAGWQPGDGVVYGERGQFPMTDLGVEYNLHGRMPLVDVLATRTAEANGTWNPPECPSPDSCLASGPQRLWVLNTYASDPFSFMEQPKIDALKKYYTVTRTSTVAGITVALMVHK
ncbi:glycosyltransferase family 39 protein [Kutzneria buriramensis]|uniref:Mannosyltransferase n=1 Tax=Kutzneria buriramensis TaxID=1045776 RepID=A0A3E0GYT4_9PSEU|nr:glycosyltransferase family 39 protein [Kutzneria buriramensis]REH32468.1 mannosyltransferase [Kutzneria buriramensis]